MQMLLKEGSPRQSRAVRCRCMGQYSTCLREAASACIAPCLTLPAKCLLTFPEHLLSTQAQAECFHSIISLPLVIREAGARACYYHWCLNENNQVQGGSRADSRSQNAVNIEEGRRLIRQAVCQPTTPWAFPYRLDNHFLFGCFSLLLSFCKAKVAYFRWA